MLQAPRGIEGLKPAESTESYSLHPGERGDMVFKAARMPSLTNYLSQMLRSPVVDETGLKGAYDFVLATSRVEMQPGENWSDRVRAAIAELGFHLVNKQVPLEVTIVDRCERPTEN